MRGGIVDEVRESETRGSRQNEGREIQQMGEGKVKKVKVRKII